MPEPVLKVHGLKRAFGAVQALRGVDLEIDGPGIYGLLGLNGAGKTTLLRILCGLIRPDQGEAQVLGRPCGQLDTRMQIGVMPQQPAFWPWMTGFELLVFTGASYGFRPHHARQRAGELLNRMGLRDAADRRIGGFSGGMKQRLALAQALVGQPALLLLDEPVSALDPVGRKDVLGLLAELGRSTTVLFSSHILADVERVAERVIMLHEGAVVLDQRMTELRAGALRPILQLRVVGDAGPLREALAARPWITRVEERQGALQLQVLDLSEAQRELPVLVSELGLGLESLSPQSPDLEDIFLRQVERRP